MFRSKHPALLREIVVNLDDGDTAMRGVLYAVKGRWLTLRNVAMLTPTADRPSQVDGEVIVDRERVLFIQAV